MEAITPDQQTLAADTDNETGDYSFKSPPPPVASSSAWHMASEVHERKNNDESGGEKPRRLGVTWDSLTVRGISSDATFNENVVSQLYPFHKKSKDAPLKTIIHNSHGCVKPGEMLLVLGRPGSGCTTLLIPNVLPPGINSAEEYVQAEKDFLLRSVGISHTAHTKVGDAFMRGVSGGERKRVSILECMTTRASVFCWDNSTRGLDASTALEWIKAIRVLTDVLGLTTIVTLYQAGNGIYEHFDKVLVLDEGQQIFYGPRVDAVPFMESLGFVRDSGSNRGDFLTGVTVPTERVIAPGFEDKFPRTAHDIHAAYEGSRVRSKMLEEIETYPQSTEAAENTAVFKESVAREKHRGVPQKSAVTTGLLTQIRAAVTRQYQIMWGDKATLILKQVATVVQALIGGSLFYNAPDNSAGLFLKGGALFFSILYNALIALSEVTDSFTGRPILAKHRSFALYHPAAVVLAQIAADFPILLFQIDCVGPYIIPSGPGYTDGRGGQSCTRVGGAVPGDTSVTGDAYLAHMSFSHSHVWRNFGIVIAWWVLFVAATIFFTNRWKQMGEGGRSLLIPREQQHKSKHLLEGASDAEGGAKEKTSPKSGAESPSGSVGKELIRNESIFTWKNLTYTVKTSDGDRVLLDNVQGYVKPGMLGALMGSSGAGKTTLLDVLAQRKTEGTIHGSVLVDGRPIPISFQRSAGYVEQLDIHESLATVREALEFSALLRQSRYTPDEEKLRYVDTIIDLLELRDLEHTLVGRPGAGLSVEQRKRLTIAVELVSKPSILIFLDEPTSGLDGQAAYNTIRFLRKLAAAGQAILVTIHQPSAQLFTQFDTLLLLAKGGKTVYFGDIGENASTVKSYFSRFGAHCPPDANPAEHIVDVVSSTPSSGVVQDWNKHWLESPEHDALSVEIDRMVEDAAARPTGTVDDGHEFAASMWTQTKLVTQRMNISLFRNIDYLDNKFAMHISLALLNGFTFWSIGDSLTDLQQNLFTIFNFIFVAPGVISQLQPLFIDRRDIYEAREKKEQDVPLGAVRHRPHRLRVSLPAHLRSALLRLLILYELLYTGIGQAIAAYAPNAVFASLVNPLVITTLVSFCGVMVPYSQIEDFWKYWYVPNNPKLSLHPSAGRLIPARARDRMYYLDPYNYLMSSLLVFTTWDKPVRCRPSELAVFDPPANETCGEYLAAFQQTAMGRGANLLNPDATAGCEVCQYTEGGDYLRTLNLEEKYFGWRNAAIVVIFCIGFYALVYIMMKLRTKATKKADGKK
ncbi:opaque-specific ABC transporter CDR3 [Verticillium alfalfae VaMs.102]|uniref:Opaque-specific ABC transporter CDR3 n=1 Tax=Verticillium alfalfae (strain VaMs.102 / ATCC MYA-4576 / FGSC 10136) TaxID=526221 RepID=C9SD22_VERA1|nr:opaque-specific ABC transporter CDR3 [Verticillium alfalfae VaMs.102]EEY16987.1 opaque-specific ABC transporter CDR3 [Verticillium alfalfae VaMs.102]